MITGRTETEEFPEICALCNERLILIGSGTVIHRNLVITAGHVSDHEPALALIGVKSIGEAGADHQRRVAARLRHRERDLALLVLEDGPAPAFPLPRLASGRDFRGRAGKLGIMAGFGRLRHDDLGSAGTKRRSAPVEIALDGTLHHEAEFLVRSGENALCKHDSGGPFFAHDDLNLLLGVGLRRARAGAECRGDSIYLRVDKFARWIKEHAGARGIRLG